MHRTTLNVSEEIFRQAKIKATAEELTISEILRTLLARWVRGEISLKGPDDSHETTVERALSSYGMWAQPERDEPSTGSVSASSGQLQG